MKLYLTIIPHFACLTFMLIDTARFHDHEKIVCSGYATIWNTIQILLVCELSVIRSTLKSMPDINDKKNVSRPNIIYDTLALINVHI